MSKDETPLTDTLLATPLVRDLQRGWKDALIKHTRTLERDRADLRELLDLWYAAGKELRLYIPEQMMGRTAALLGRIK